MGWWTHSCFFEREYGGNLRIAQMRTHMHELAQFRFARNAAYLRYIYVPRQDETYDQSNLLTYLLLQSRQQAFLMFLRPTPREIQTTISRVHVHRNVHKRSFLK
jgi:hypothetical protein